MRVVAGVVDAIRTHRVLDAEDGGCLHSGQGIASIALRCWSRRGTYTCVLYGRAWTDREAVLQDGGSCPLVAGRPAETMDGGLPLRHGVWYGQVSAG
jgi:hypothetical protein